MNKQNQAIKNMCGLVLKKAPPHVKSEVREILTITNILVFPMEIATRKCSTFHSKAVG